MNKEAIEKEIAKLNKKIQFEAEEIKRVAELLIQDVANPENINIFCRSRAIAESEKNIKEYIARRDAFAEILKTLYPDTIKEKEYTMRKKWKPNKRNSEIMEREEVDYQMEFDEEYGWQCFVYAPKGRRFESSGCHTDHAYDNGELDKILNTVVACTDPDCEYCITAPDCPLYN